MKQLAIDADLHLTIDGEDVHVTGHDDELVVDLPSTRAGQRLLASNPLGGVHDSPLPTLHQVLDRYGLTALVRLKGRETARLGRRAEPSRLARLVGLGDIELHTRSSIGAVVRDSPLAAGAIAAGLLGLATWGLLRLRQ